VYMIPLYLKKKQEKKEEKLNDVTSYSHMASCMYTIKYEKYNLD
jgi:hypothetical protein